MEKPELRKPFGCFFEDDPEGGGDSGNQITFGLKLPSFVLP